MNFIYIFLLSSLLVAGKQLYNPNEYKKDFYQNFDVQPGASLVLDHGNGRVDLTSWDKDVVNVVVHYHSERQSAYSLPGNDLFDVHFKQMNDLITISGKEVMPKGITVGSRRVYDYYYLIQGPPYLNLELHGRKGNISVNSWTGSISSESTDAQIALKNINSPSVDIKMNDGMIQADSLKGLFAIESEDCEINISCCQTSLGQIDLADGILQIDRGSGNFNIRSDKGKVDLKKMTVRQLGIRSDEADIDVELLRSEKLAVNIKSAEGNIKVSIDADNSAAFTIKPTEGEVESDRIEMKEENGNYYGIIGSGDGLIQLETHEGDITIHIF